MENEVINSENKSKKALIISLVSGITAILIGIAIFLGIFLTTKDYRLVKNNYDIYLNSESKELTKNDVYYYLADDAEFFNYTENEVTIDINKVKENNDDFLTNDYFIEVSILVEAQNYDATKDIAPSLSIDSNVDVKSEGSGNYYLNTSSNLGKFYFDDSLEYFSIILKDNSLETSNATFKISNFAFGFYSLKR